MRHISLETVLQMREQSSDGMSCSDIAALHGVSTSTVSGYLSQYGSQYALAMARLRRQGFSTFKEYDEAHKLGMNAQEYHDLLVENSAYDTYEELRESIRVRRTVREHNLLGSAIREGLNGRSQTWLASQLGFSKMAVSDYCRGSSIPDEGITSEIFRILESPYRRLEDLVLTSQATQTST